MIKMEPEASSISNCLTSDMRKLQSSELSKEFETAGDGEVRSRTQIHIKVQHHLIELNCPN